MDPKESSESKKYLHVSDTALHVASTGLGTAKEPSTRSSRNNSAQTSNGSNATGASNLSAGDVPRVSPTETLLVGEAASAARNNVYAHPSSEPIRAPPTNDSTPTKRADASSTSPQGKAKPYKRRNSTDLLLIAAAQREADEKDSGKKNEASKLASSSPACVVKQQQSDDQTANQESRSSQTSSACTKVSPKKSGKKGKANKPTSSLPQPHVYHDYSGIPDTAGYMRKKTGGVSQPFPEKLMDMLAKESKDNPSVVTWLPHGRAFIVRKPKEFASEVMPKYFRQTKITSFQRQLNLYGFRRLTQGSDAGAYYHQMFLRGRMQLCMRMTRQKVKGTGHKQPSHAESEPNLYALPHLPDDFTFSDQRGDNDSVQLTGIHQTPATTTTYYTAASIAPAHAQKTKSNDTTSPILASPAIQAAQLLKSMATARVTPGSFAPMLTLGPAWGPQGLASQQIASQNITNNRGVPPPPPLAGGDISASVQQHVAQDTGTQCTRDHVPNFSKSNANNAHVCTTDSKDTEQGSKLQMEKIPATCTPGKQQDISPSVDMKAGSPSKLDRSNHDKLSQTESPQKLDAPQPAQ